MKKYLLYLIFIASINVYSQTPIGALTYGTVNNPKFIVFDERLPRSTDAQAILQGNLKLNPDAQYVMTQQITDQLGRKHEKYQQYYKGIKVNSGVYSVHYNSDGTIGAISGNYYSVDHFNTTPTLAVDVALSKALASIQAKEYAWQNPQSEQWLRTTTKDSNATFYPVGELLVYPVTDSLDSFTYSLAYQFNVVSSQPFNSVLVVVDALTGSIINKTTTFSSTFGDACTHYSGTTQINTTLLSNDYILYDNVRNIHTYDLLHGNDPTFDPIAEFEDVNNLISPNDWTCAEWDNGLKDNVALDAHWAAEMTYDYFLQKHNRNSYDGQGSVLDVYVHHQLMDYAAWLGTNLSPVWSVFGMAFGDGNGSQFDALVSLDIVAHEFGHGVTQTSSNLLPSGTSESPAINEGLSDIWGAAVEYWVLNDPIVNFTDPQGDKDPWLAGEEVRIGYDAQRSLKDPKSFTVATRMADTYNGINYSGLRGKSGIMSHWFYLISVGSAATDEVNDNLDPFTITGIGIGKAADIIYLAQTVYFTELTDYKDARQATLQAAKDLYGSCSIEAQTVSAAWDAVGVPVFSLYNLPSFGACGEVNSLGVQTGIYDGSGFANIVVATPADGGVVYSGTTTFCTQFSEIVVENGASAVFKASDKVLLEPGFKAERGSNFKAYIFECVGAGNYRLGNSGSNNNNGANNNQLVTINTQNNLLIYPNPTSGQFTIELENLEEETRMEMYSLMGKKISSKRILQNKQQINLSNYPKGIYLIKVSSGNQVFTNKIIYQ